MLYSISLQSACSGFIFHWIISDAVYLQNNPVTRNILYFLFIVNLIGIAYGHIILSRDKQINEAINNINNFKYERKTAIANLAEGNNIEEET